MTRKMSMQMFFGKFRPYEDIEQRIPCPACKSVFTATTLLFYKCAVRLGYRLKSAEHETQSLAFDTHSDDKCEVFGGHMIPARKYKNLIFIVQPLLPQGHGALPVEPSTDAKLVYGFLWAAQRKQQQRRKMEHMDPFAIRLSQKSCPSTFCCGRLMVGTSRALSDGTCSVYELPEIKVVSWKNHFDTTNNRHLWAFHQATAGHAPVKFLHPATVATDELTTINEGKTIQVSDEITVDYDRLLHS